jgi:pimeloyl-ACP methyl ester carboxylesterase
MLQRKPDAGRDPHWSSDSRASLMLRFGLVLVVIAALLLAAMWLASLWVVARIEAQFPPVGKFVDIDGRGLHYIDRGPRDAPPEKTFLFIHGASGNLNDWLFAFKDQMPGDIRWIAIDRPGHGWSQRGDLVGDSDLGVQANLLSRFLETIGAPKVGVVGHSFGAAVALRLALDHPQRANSLTLIAPVSHPWPGGVAWHYTVTATPVIGPIFARVVAPAAGWLMIDRTIEGIFAPAPVPPGYAEGIAAALVLEPSSFQANGVDVKNLLPQIIAQVPRYSLLAMPLMIITSDTDTVVSPQIHAESLARAVTGSRLIVLPGTGHAPHHSATASVLPLILETNRVLALQRP